MKFFAATQLWLLFTLCLDPPGETPESDLTTLLAHLEQCSALQVDKLDTDQAKDKLGKQIEELEAEINWVEGPPKIYGLRVLECVMQCRGTLAPDERWSTIDNELASTPSCLRGLGSFTPLHMRQPRAFISYGEPEVDREHVSIALESQEGYELQEVRSGETSQANI
ncbi:hypothetical protein RSOLAG1IB_07227 [Rhizoctonia solani AG-1 IB]|uniref:Uncharacterized protein n=1 Tax=Thanatephorus cucumeris (strain AG1-IB / isolate 7/3/14) TaxID=1108050 RepID=A0A0B7FES0_THACB|nr:hypothetical protein RSOLAG1IB_07227 [Rhizoctonia solani AG-1 IB]